jgi:hypothetical protein
MANLYTKQGTMHDINDKDILLNDVVLPQEFNPHNVRLWIIGHEFGAICAVWASCEQDAFDEMLNAGYEHFLVENPEEDLEYCYLGNAGEPCNLDYAWITPVEFDFVRDYRALIALAEARGAGQSVLWS